MNDLASDFAETGYAVIRNALDPALCQSFGDEVTSEYQRLTGSGWVFRESGGISGHLNIRMGQAGRGLIAAFREAGLEDTIRSLAGEPAELMQAVGNLNVPGSCTQDFHMDGGFDRPILIANVCLVPTTARNGATELVPESHLTHLSYWRFARDGWRKRVIAPQLQPGDVLIRVSTVWHRGTPNHSAVPRPMASFAYVPSRLVPDDAHCTDLDGPLTIFANKYYGRFRRLKEFTAARLPLLDEALRQGRSLLAERALHSNRA